MNFDRGNPDRDFKVNVSTVVRKLYLEHLSLVEVEKRERKEIEFVIEKLLPEYVEEHIGLYKPHIEEMSHNSQEYYWSRMKEKYGVIK